jgi:hypothetical protein
MNATNFSQLKKMYEDVQMPHKVIKLSEMSYLGDNVFNVQGKEVVANATIEQKLDRLVGISSHQREWVQNASDKSGLKNFRNYMQVAYDMHAMQEIVVVADANSRQIVDVVPLKEEYLSVSTFFRIIEIFLNESGYSLQNSFFNSNQLSQELTVYLQSPSEETITLAVNEVFFPNGIFMRWNFSEIEVGNFFTRLVCMNGATEQSSHTQARINSFNDKVLQQLIGNTQIIIEQGFKHYSDRIMEAMRTTLSLYELHSAHKALLQVGLQEEQAEEIIPYSATIEKAKNQGILDNTIYLQRSNIATNFNKWQIYNQLTTFATHNTIWSENDLNRQRVLNSASRLLNKKPDIKHIIAIE